MDARAIAERLDTLAKEMYSRIEYSEWAQLHSAATLLRVGTPHEICTNQRPNKEYFQYYLKTFLDGRINNNRAHDAGECYEFPDGHVEIWCGGNDNKWRVYKYDSMDLTHDWMLD